MEDLLDALSRIRIVISDMDRATYSDSQHWMERAAVERFIGIAGEALVWLRHHHPDVFSLIPDGGRAISLRNVVIHRYESLDDDVIWQTVTSQFSALAEQVRALLPDERSDPDAEVNL